MLPKHYAERLIASQTKEPGTNHFVLTDGERREAILDIEALCRTNHPHLFFTPEENTINSHRWALARAERAIASTKAV
jgi:hypothetical protein